MSINPDELLALIVDQMELISIGLKVLPRSGLVQDNFMEAEPLYRRGVMIAESTLGTGNPDYANALGDLAGLLRIQVWSELLPHCSTGDLYQIYHSWRD